MSRKSHPASPQLPLLVGSSDPQRLFAEFEQLLVSNSGEDAFDVAVRLVAAKLEDELAARSNESPLRFMTSGDVTADYGAVEDLLRVAESRWPGVIEFNGGLGITAEQLARCARPLMGWNILDTSFHHLDALLERLVARSAKGALGQYFTPRPVIRMCIAAVNPGSDDTVLDPACGSGGFLVEAIEHADRATRQGDGPACLGIDYSARSLKVASLLAVAADGGRIRVDRGNSIDGREYVGREAPAAWEGHLRSLPSGLPWGVWDDLEATVVVTNPPFAGDVDESEILDRYDSQHETGARGRAAVSREHLFLERTVRLLKPGGRLAIVLPQGLLANSSAEYLRSWLLREVRVLAVVGLHPNTFIPNTGVKTSVLFAVKETPTAEYPILFATSEDPGKDSRGRVVGQGDYEQVARLVQQFAHAEGYPWAQAAVGNDFAKYTVMLSDAVAAGRLDSEFFDPQARRALRQAMAGANGHVLGAVTRKLPKFKRQEHDEIDYIDISSVDSRTGVPIPSRLRADEAPSRARTIVQAGDVLVSTVRPDRNVVGFVQGEPDGTAVASNGFCILRPQRIAPELLFAFCKSNLFRTLAARHATASMYPAIGDNDVLNVPLVVPAGSTADEVVSKVRSAFQKVEEARLELAEAIGLVNAFHDALPGVGQPASANENSPR